MQSYAEGQQILDSRRFEWHYLFLFLTAMMWGGAFVAAKFVVLEMHPLVAAAVRFSISFLFLLPFFLRWEGLKNLPKLRDLPVLLLLAATGVFLYNALFFYGMRTSAATDGALVIASSPMITAIISFFVLKERFGPGQLLGFFLCLAGVTVIITKGSLSVLAALAVNQGDLMLFGCAVSWAVYSVAGKIATGRMTPLASSTFSNGLGAVMLLIAAGPFLPRQSFLDLSPATIGSMLFLAVFASGVAFVFWLVGVNKVGAGRTSIFVNMVPVWSALLGVLFLGERLALFHLVGAVLTLGGVYLVTHKDVGSRKSDAGMLASGKSKLQGIRDGSACDVRLTGRR